MFNRKAALAIAFGGWVVACGSGEAGDAVSADIANVADVESSFGPEFEVKNIGKTGIDPRMLANRKLPDGLRFDPPDCSKFVISQQIPDNVEGNMAAVTAEGDGSRYVAIAVETSKPVPLNDPGRGCQKVGFAGGNVQGLVETIDAPRIDGARTLGVHRIQQAIVDGEPRAGGELYNYSAHLGRYQVIVTANPLAQPGRPAATVDTARAKDLLAAAVAAIRG